MKVTVYTKSSGTFDVDLKEGVKFTYPQYQSGSSSRVGDLICIGETDAGSVYVSKDELVAIGPPVEPATAG